MPAARRFLLVVALVAACLADCAGDARSADPDASPAEAPADTGLRAEGTRTVVERRLGGGALAVTVTEGVGGTAATMEAVDEDGRRTLLVEEVVRGDDHYVHLAAAEHVLFQRAAWIHFDLSDERHVAFLAANRLGLVELADAPPSPGTVVTRTPLVPAPVVTVPDSLPVIPFDDVEHLARRPARP